MKKTILSLSLLTISVASLNAQTIIAGDPGYVGDFTGQTITDGSVLVTASQLGGGWVSSGTGTWVVTDNGGDDVAFRDNAVTRFASSAVGITFDASSIENQTVTLTFDYAASSGSTNSGEAAFVVYANNGAGTKGNATLYGVSNVNTYTPQADTRIVYDGSTSGTPIAATGTHSVSVQFNVGDLSSTNAVGERTLTFVFSMNNQGNGGVSDAFLDNVTITVPEPSTYALLAGLGAVGLLAIRRRK